jgi:ribA/ribD-fused uncharacterized protein
MQMPITFFWKGPLSQWHPSQFKTFDSALMQIMFANAEQYMMYQKAILFNDQSIAKQILATSSPRKCKELGRQIAGFNNDVWKLKARDIVYNGNILKFTQNSDLRQQLLNTANTLLVEASPDDCLWGIGLAEDDPRALDQSQWRGLNWLGETLTKVRESILMMRSF